MERFGPNRRNLRFTRREQTTDHRSILLSSPIAILAPNFNADCVRIRVLISLVKLDTSEIKYIYICVCNGGRVAFTTLIYRRSIKGKGGDSNGRKGNIGQRPSKFDSNRAAERNINRIGKFAPSFVEEYRCNDRLKLQAVAFLGKKFDLRSTIDERSRTCRRIDG